MENRKMHKDDALGATMHRPIRSRPVTLWRCSGSRLRKDAIAFHQMLEGGRLFSSLTTQWNITHDYLDQIFEDLIYGIITGWSCKHHPFEETTMQDYHCQIPLIWSLIIGSCTHGTRNRILVMNLCWF